MSSYHEPVKRVLSEFNKFLKVTLQSENLSATAESEKNKIIKLLQKLFADYNSLAPNFGDEGSVSSTKDSASGSIDESRNTIDSHGSEEDSYGDSIAATTVKNLVEHTKMGFLEKKQEILFKTTTWQKRYCVLHKNILYIFKKPGDKKQQGAFYVTGYEVREAPQLIKDEKKKKCCFELVCPGKKTHQFLCESRDDLEEWKKVLEAAASNVPLVDDETCEDVYEEYREQEGRPATKPPEDDDYIDAKSSPISLNTDPKKNLKAEEEVHDNEDDDNLVYEEVEQPKLASKQEATPPIKHQQTPVSCPPPVLSQLLKVPKDSKPLPPVPPRDEDQPPPVPPSRTVPPPPESPRPLPPPPTHPLPPVPTTPKKMITPTLGKILHPKEDFENLFHGKWDCDGSTDNELSFKRGDVVHVISRDLDNDDWWVGALDGKVGLVPKNFLTPAYELVC